jgi:thiol-disulfide isomerase/thioredoxin
MDRKFFLIGFLAGIIGFVGLVGLVYMKFVVQPDISLASMQLQDLDGKAVNNMSFVGKPLVVNYWATWCGPCLKEFPLFEQAKTTLGDDVKFVMVSDETPDIVKPFKANNSYTFNYLLSTKELDISARPTTYFYNARGVLVSKVVGSIDEKSLLDNIQKIK